MKASTTEEDRAISTRAYMIGSGGILRELQEKEAETEQKSESQPSSYLRKRTSSKKEMMSIGQRSTRG